MSGSGRAADELEVASEWEEGAGWGGAEWQRLGDWANGEQTPSDAVVSVLNWDVPVAELVLGGNPTGPRPALRSARMCTRLESVSLDWQLSLTQEPDETRLQLHFVSPGLPNAGVEFAAFAERRDGQGRTALSVALRRALAKLRTRPGLGPQLLNPRTIWARRHVFPAPDATTPDSVHLKILVKASPERFRPARLMATLLERERASSSDYADGVIGRRLWAQVSAVGASAADLPAEADVVFECSDGAAVFAHRTVLAAFCPRFRRLLDGAEQSNRWVIRSGRLDSAAMWEVLHLVYLRSASASLYKASLGGVLEAGRIFGAPRLLGLEVEALLIRVLSPRNAVGLWTLAQTYGLRLLSNLVLTASNDQPDLRPQLRHISDSLRAQSLTA